MYLKIIFEDIGETPVYIYDEFKKFLKPLTSKAIKWKEEIYFETDLDLKGEETYTVSRGDFAYWPPGKALCLFLGVNQPYGKVIKLGWVLGQVHLPLLAVKENTSVRIEKVEGEKHEVVKALENEGIKAVLRKWEEVQSIAGAWVLYRRRIGFEIYIEDFGYVVESDPLFKYNQSLFEEIFIRSLNEKLSRDFSTSRVDIDEEGYIILSTYAENIAELVQAVKRLVLDYIKIERQFEKYYLNL